MVSATIEEVISEPIFYASTAFPHKSSTADMYSLPKTRLSPIPWFVSTRAFRLRIASANYAIKLLSRHVKTSCRSFYSTTGGFSFLLFDTWGTGNFWSIEILAYHNALIFQYVPRSIPDRDIL